MPFGHLLGAENKPICRISGKKSGRSCYEVVTCERVCNIAFIWPGNKPIIFEVVAYRRWSLTKTGRYKSIDCIPVLANKNKSYVWYEYEIACSGGLCSFKHCVQPSFCNWLVLHVFRFGVTKPTLMVCLITLVVISFWFCINISKLNMLLWAAVLWLSCCNCCVD